MLKDRKSVVVALSQYLKVNFSYLTFLKNNHSYKSLQRSQTQVRRRGNRRSRHIHRRQSRNRCSRTMVCSRNPYWDLRALSSTHTLRLFHLHTNTHTPHTLSGPWAWTTIWRTFGL
ncbi:hypothetical protein PGIGA_G00054920 [Pangasianodon gigas]|uniref:Uncharacterized protein n=1 Tax=Pangasianodon gigas TaxID=30993 RepID=A0ACC5X3E5_PANGG|nr:hypothetical protein [Pangasianodon gigas]